MHCKFCGFANGEDDHRCLRCGRRSSGIVIAAPPAFSGANALAAAPAFDPRQTQDFAPAPILQQPAQPALFPPFGQKVIPFEQLQRHITGKLNAAAVARPASRKSAGPVQEQTSIDFVQASVSAPRTLKTAVPAQIYCDHPVATPMHRFVAGAMDTAMIFLAFGLFIVLAQVSGGNFGEGKFFWGLMLLSFILLSLFYGLIWTVSGRETIGMSWSELQLVTFDGFAVDNRARAIRTAATWLSFCAGGIGVLWAAADEEKLAWHDHISKTFPTMRDSQSSFNRQRR